MDRYAHLCPRCLSVCDCDCEYDWDPDRDEGPLIPASCKHDCAAFDGGDFDDC